MKSPKVAIVCGYGDVGKAVAKKLAEQGYAVAIISRSFDANSEYVFFKCDIRDMAQVQEAVRQITEKFNNIDACIYTAASEIKRQHMLDLSAEEFREDFETLVFGGFNVLKEIGQVMKNQKHGTVIGVTSAVTEPNYASGKMGGYVAAKYALRGVLRQMNHELLGHGVRVHAVAPGFMRTKLNKDIPGRMDDFLVEKNPMKHLVTPEEVAEVVLFLISDKAKYLSGLSVPVTAGESSEL